MADTPLPPPPEHTTVAIEEEMRRSYLDYAMSVIVSRALPDVRDGLKPVHRRILFTMKEGGYDRAHPFRKSARIVGDVMGKYHPHGDSAIYDAMVRMAQPFAMRLPLIEGQGNFGSVDGDPPAAMRYTEARMAEAAEALLADIDRETVDFQPNYDESSQEPKVLPAEFPNLLVNGAGGIAVGMATNIPPHNLGEVIDACCAYVDDPEVTVAGLMEHVRGPDFPTGAIILGRGGIMSAYETGRGSIRVRARTNIEIFRGDREAIIVTEIPYQLNKSRLMERIAEVVQDRTIEGISDLRDESDRDGMRIVIELRRDANTDVVLNQLYRYTPLQGTFSVNMLALDGGRPITMNLRDIIVAFVAFREEVITRRTAHELKRARERAHILIGLAIAVANMDPIIAAIRASKDPAAAREALMAEPWPAGDVAPLIALVDEPGHTVEDGGYRLSDVQARAILDLRLHRLTALERGKISDELDEVVARITGYLEILTSREKLRTLLRAELVTVRDRFADDRRTTLEEGEIDQDIEDLIQREDMVVTVTHTGYVKRVPLSTYRAQHRGGKGRAGMSTREEDFVTQVFVVNTHTPVLFFSSRGMAYQLKVYRLPLGTPQARGKALVNLLPLTKGETISTLMPLPEDEERWAEQDVVFATRLGHVRRNLLSDFTNIFANGKIAMKLEPGDALVGVLTASDANDVLLATRAGRCIRFPVADVRLFKGRNSVGVRGVRLAKDDEVISMSILRHTEFDASERDAYFRRRRANGEAEEAETVAGEAGAEAGEELVLSEERYAELAATEEFILTIASTGYGKRTSAHDYRVTARGGKGIELMDLGRDEGVVAAAFPVFDTDGIVLVTDSGQVIRCPVGDIRIARRGTRGVMLFRVDEQERVVSVARLDDEDEVEVEGEAEAGAVVVDAAAAGDGQDELNGQDEPDGADEPDRQGE